MPQLEMGPLDLRFNECQKITVSYLSLNKHIYETQTSLNEQLELLPVILWSLFLTFSTTVSLAGPNVEWTLYLRGGFTKFSKGGWDTCKG